MATHPINIPDGVYSLSVKPLLGHIEQAIERALLIADAQGTAWLVFNGTSVRVDRTDSTHDVFTRWTEHRNAYQTERAK